MQGQACAMGCRAAATNKLAGTVLRELDATCDLSFDSTPQPSCEQTRVVSSGLSIGHNARVINVCQVASELSSYRSKYRSKT